MSNMSLVPVAFLMVLVLGACASTPSDQSQLSQQEREAKHQRLLAENEYAQQERRRDAYRQQVRERDLARRQMRTCTVDSSGKQVCN